MSVLERWGLAALICAWMVYGSGQIGNILVSVDHVAPAMAAVHGEDAVAEAEEEAVAAEPEIHLATLLASASSDDGEKVFGKCKACHTVEEGGKHKIGPNLWNVIGGPVAARDFSYSSAFGEAAEAWSYEALNAFLEDPKGFAPGSKMSFAGLRKPEDRAAVIVYLRDYTENPPPLPEPPIESAEAPVSEETVTAALDTETDSQASAPEPVDTAESEEASETEGAETPAPDATTGTDAASAEFVESPKSEGTETAASEGKADTDAAADEPAEAPEGQQTETAALEAEADTGAATPEPVEAAETKGAETATPEAQADAGTPAAEPEETSKTEEPKTAALDTTSEAAPPAAEPAAADSLIAAVLASADAEKGARVFRKCKACHALEQGARHKMGPNLWNIVGRQVAAADDYKYSDALIGHGGTWTYAELDAYLTDPKGFAPGNKMVFSGLRKPGDRANVILYLREHTESPPPLP